MRNFLVSALREPNRKLVKSFYLLVFILVTTHAPAAVLVVNNINDSGPGSFRQAILDANATNGLDVIEFHIPGSGPFTISPLSPLPPLNDAAIVDATTQTGFSGQPLVELNGTAAGDGTVGIRVASPGCTIRGLAINRFSADGIRLDSSGNFVEGNFIGTDPTGTIARANGQYGVFVLGTSTNTIGGLDSTKRNVISGNDTGVYILNGAGNIVQGNYIGVNPTGNTALGNTNNGITIFSSAANIIGGTTPGSGNVISGNGGSGINLNGNTAAGNVIQGNYIGVNSSASGAINNVGDGITLNGAPGNFIGGDTAGARNIISGNAKAGIFLNGSAARLNTISGNYIGTDGAGTAAIANQFAGITISGAVSNQIGGPISAARNVISGNLQDGIFATAQSSGNRIEGNFIGVNAAGTAALGNQFTGVTLQNSASNVIAGNPGAPSVISGNKNVGINIQGIGSSNNVVAGNLIGPSASGTSALGNSRDGVRISDAINNMIGGSTAAERNVISGNGFAAGVGAGVSLENSLSSGNVVAGNYIGTDINGQSPLANRNEGIYALSVNNNVIGGATPGMGNLISANTTRGIRLTNSCGNEILGNYFGIKSDGVTALANGQFNIELEQHSHSNRIGGLTINAGNRVGFSGGGFAAIRIRDLATNNAILGNAVFSNSGLGIDVSAAGVTANDNCDGDSGGNQRQNFPVISYVFSGSTTTIRGTLNSSANSTFRLQFFSSSTCDPQGNGEAEVFLGEKIVTASAGCAVDFVATLPIQVSPGHVITATATDSANNTSEFSACVQAQPWPELAIASATGDQITLAWPTSGAGLVLKETDNLTPPVQWNVVTNLPQIINGNFTVTFDRADGNRFYLLSFE